MISLLNDTGVDYLGGERNRYASALIEGAMEMFFKADHIVFDLGLPRKDREVLPDRETAAGIARSGGADYMLDLRIGAPEESTEIPEYVVYDFIDLANSFVLVSGTVKKTEINTKVTDALHICLLLGQKAASTAVRALE